MKKNSPALCFITFSLYITTALPKKLIEKSQFGQKDINGNVNILFVKISQRNNNLMDDMSSGKKVKEMLLDLS